MALKNFDQLTYEVDQAVHPNGPLGKTTAPGLNAVLKSFATELTTLPTTLESSSGGPQLISYAELLTQQQAGSLRPGTYYLITQRPTTTLGSSGDVLALAVTGDALAPDAVLCARVPDYAAAPVWQAPAAPLGEITGVGYTQQTEPYTAVVPTLYDAVDRHVIGDDLPYVISLPFPFVFGGVSYAECEIDTNGRLVFGSANYGSSNEPQVMGSSAVPLIAFAWCDLVVTAATFRTFVTGEAPYRRLVFDYNRVPLFPRYFLGGNHYDTEDTITGQIVLEETTNRISLGVASNTNPDTTVAQGLQYPGHAYPLHTGQALPSNVLTTFTPLTERATASAPAAGDTGAAASLVTWRGRMWALTTGSDASQEPGTGPAWTLATATGADAFGNTLPVCDEICYALLTDEVSERRDGAGNVVRGASALAAFPWGHPAVRDNRVLDCQLDDSLLTTQALRLTGNRFVRSQFTRVNLSDVDVRDNNFYEVSLLDYAPTQLEQVTAYFQLDQTWPGLRQQVLVDGQPVRDTMLLLATGLQAFKTRFLDGNFVTYVAGQAPSYAPLDLLDPINSDYTVHDLIELRGSFKDRSLCLRNQNYRVSGDAIFGGAFMGAATSAQTLSVTGLTFLNGFPLFCATSGSGGHQHTYASCTIGSLGYYGSSSGTLNTYTFSRCTIGRMSGMNGQSYQHVNFDSCVFGLGITSGSVFGGGRGAGNGPIIVANSTVILQGTATLFDAGFDQTYAPVFQNVTLVAADGTVSRLDNQATTVSQASSATLAGLEVIAVATLGGTISANGFNTLPIGSPGLDVRPSGTVGGWDQPNNAYVAPLGGTYEILTRARIDDSSGPVGGNYALGAGPSNVDGAWVAWNTIGQTTGTNRKGHQTTRILHLNTGDAVHMYLYLDGFNANVGGEMSIKLLRRD